MNLTDEQKQAIKGWLHEGAGLSEVQRRLSGEFGITMTYMDVRFLVIDLGLEVQEPEKEKVSVPEVGASVEPGEAAIPGETSVGSGVGGVSVEVDRIMQPGSVVSGSVVFSDGTKATWLIDQRGRLALQADTPGYRPGEDDLASFQEEIQQALAKRGF